MVVVSSGSSSGTSSDDELLLNCAPAGSASVEFFSCHPLSLSPAD